MPATYTNLLFHVVFSTKERRPAIDLPMQDALYEYIGGIVRGQRNVLLEIGGVADHIYLAIRMRADLSVAEVVRDIKANSSKWLREERKLQAWPGWQSGYGAFTVSQSQLGTLRRYIRNQEAHHKKHSFQDEIISLLRKHCVEYDPEYLWN